MAHGSILNKETDTSNLLPLDGSKAMTGTLQANAGIDVNNNRITNLADPTANTDAVNFKTIQPYRSTISSAVTARYCVTFNNIIMDVTSTGTSGTTTTSVLTKKIFWLLPQLLATTNAIIQSWADNYCTGTFMDMDGTSMSFECNNTVLILRFPSNLSVGTHIFYLHDITYPS